jgi:hypothetical protein
MATKKMLLEIRTAVVEGACVDGATHESEKSYRYVEISPTSELKIGSGSV